MYLRCKFEQEICQVNPLLKNQYQNLHITSARENLLETVVTIGGLMKINLSLEFFTSVQL